MVWESFLEKSGQHRAVLIRELNDEKELHIDMRREPDSRQVEEQDRCIAHGAGRHLLCLRNSKRQEHSDQGGGRHGTKPEKQAGDSSQRGSG